MDGTVSQDSPHGLEKGDNEFGVFGGGSFDSPTIIGTTDDARFGVISLRYGRVLIARQGIAFEYTVDVTPVTALSLQRFIVLPTGSGPFDFSVRRTRESVYGAGLSPVGFKTNFRRRSRVQPFASASGGFLYFSKPVPEPEATQFNFTFDFGGGVQVFTHSRRAITFGYKFQHISSGGRSEINPGVDANVFYAGFSIFR